MEWDQLAARHGRHLPCSGVLRKPEGRRAALSMCGQGIAAKPHPASCSPLASYTADQPAARQASHRQVLHTCSSSGSSAAAAKPPRPPTPAPAAAATVKGLRKATTSPACTVLGVARGSRRTSRRSTASGWLRQEAGEECVLVMRKGEEQRAARQQEAQGAPLTASQINCTTTARCLPACSRTWLPWG